MAQQMTPSQLRRGYGPIYRRLSRCGAELSYPSKLVLINLMERVGQSARDWGPPTTIAEDTGLSSHAVNAALASLGEAGFVSSQHLPGRNIYELELGALIEWAERGTGGNDDITT